MSGTIRTSRELDSRRRRILYRAWHRGFREMDLIMGRFCDASITTMTDEELDLFEQLVDADDHALYDWITSTTPVPPAHDTAIFRKLRDFHVLMKPVSQ